MCVCGGILIAVYEDQPAKMEILLLYNTKDSFFENYQKKRSKHGHPDTD